MKKSIFYSNYAYKYNDDVKQGKTDIPFLEKCIEYAKEDGIEGIEILPTGDLDSKDVNKALDYAKRLREKMDEQGIVCACYSHGISMLYSDDPVADLKKCVDVAKILGSPFLHHTFQCSFDRKNLPPHLTVYEIAEKIFVDVGRQTAEYAGEKGIECIYEDQGFFLNTVDRLGGLLAKIDMPNTGVCLDCGNSLFYHIPAETFAGAFASLIKHVHIKDYIMCDSINSPGAGWDATYMRSWLSNCRVGTGLVNFEKIFSILNSVDYDGFFSLENPNTLINLTPDATRDEIRKSFETMERIYQKVKA